jgi:uncharacterized Zn finger protein (UPF0148 family)
MAKFRCRACGEEGIFVHDGRLKCPNCGSADVQFAFSIEELPDDDPLIEELERPAEDSERTATDLLLWTISDLHLELTRGWDLPSAGAS